LAAAPQHNLVIALLDQLQTNLQGNPLDVTGADVDTGPVQRAGGVGKGTQSGRGVGDPLQDGGTEVMIIPS
jgi:hypothetical protein